MTTLRSEHLLLLLTLTAVPVLALAEQADQAVLPPEYGDPIQYRNITLIPVTSTEPGPFRRYTLLEQGLKAKTFAVRERAGSSDEAEVNEIEVRNKGTDPVYLLGGEMILGGKQDRIIQTDTIVAADGKWQKVAVFCVEQGRWQGQRMEFSGSGAVAHLDLQAAAMSGDQGKVWAAVAKSNEAHGTTSETQTYRRTIQNGKVRQRIAGYRSELEKLLPTAPIAGVIFAINGEIQVADLFGNPELFGALREKLLSAYILEALEHDVDADAKPLAKSVGAGFVEDAKKAPTQGKLKSLRGVTTRKESDAALSSEVVDELDGAPVRSTYINKKKSVGSAK